MDNLENGLKAHLIPSVRDTLLSTKKTLKIGLPLLPLLPSLVIITEDSLLVISEEKD